MLDSSTQEFTRSKLKLRDDLIFTAQRNGGDALCHIEDPPRGKFFRIGFAEYTFLSLLDGKTSVAQALTLTARALGPNAFTERESTSICRWLLENKLVDSAAGPIHQPTAQSNLTQRLNPFWSKIPLCRPDRVLDWSKLFIGWTQSAAMGLIAIPLIVAGIVTVAGEWDRFQSSSTDVFSPGNWLWMGLAWLMLKLIHEVSHAIACKRHGGEVREMGVIFILFAPLAYVDVTSCWRFRARWQRIHTAAAGMMSELVLASVAALLWARTDSVVLGRFLHDVMLMASLTTLLFNANPLMRFDGYYILSDLLDLPNLYGTSSAYVRNLTARVFLGRQAPPLRECGVKALFVKCYGVAALVWRVVICVSLTMGASVMFHGAGIALAALGIVLWLGGPLVGCVTSIRREVRTRPHVLSRLIGSTTAVSLACVAVLMYVPWPGGHTVPGIVEFDPLEVVRTDTSGFVRRVHVSDGELVMAGTLLVELENQDLEAEVRDLELSLEQSRARHRVHMRKQEIASAQIEESLAESINQRLADKRAELAGLSIRAPVSGRVMSRHLETLVDTYLKAGSELASIGNDRNVVFRMAVHQNTFDVVNAAIGSGVSIRLQSGDVLEGTVREVVPRASHQPTHPALCAPNCGPLAVTVDAGDDGSNSELRLTTPHFSGRVAIDSADANLHPGQLGMVAVHSSHESLAGGVYNRLYHWFHAFHAAARRSIH
ncbi:MAG: efflux RND transporter periplasmic adaptor subunit [Planctomycetota bacterium]|nr:efflux RND transporter periplasmic adaptor subunit [Planctomycetota bacterium]